MKISNKKCKAKGVPKQYLKKWESVLGKEWRIELSELLHLTQEKQAQFLWVLNNLAPSLKDIQKWYILPRNELSFSELDIISWASTNKHNKILKFLLHSFMPCEESIPIKKDDSNMDTDIIVVIGDTKNDDKCYDNTNINNTGYHNTGSYNTGYHNTGSYNTGDHNTGSYNTGDRNAGSHNLGTCNTGDSNEGVFNTGDCNIGKLNVGTMNKGNYNIGMFNSCSYSNGIFCTEEHPIRIFNMLCDLTFAECKETGWFQTLSASLFRLTYNDNINDVVGSYKGACSIWWATLSANDREIVKTIPNFDAGLFYEITGILI